MVHSSKSPKIDVVIPAYNAAKFIADTIQSVLRQTLSPHKIIIVDDGSTDNTLEIVQNFNSELIEVISVSNGGVSCARNIGIKASQSDYIAFLDADDFWEQDKLKAQIEELFANPNARAVYSYAIMCDEKGQYTKNAHAYNNTPYQSGSLPEKLLFEFVNLSGSASSVMVETKLLKSTTLFDETMTFAEDIDLWFRIASLTEFILVPKEHVKIRVNTSSSTRKLSWSAKKKMISDHFYFMHKYAKDYQIPRATIDISLSYLTRSFVKRPHRIMEFFYFHKHLRNRAPDYFRQISNHDTAIRFFFRTITVIIMHPYRRIRLIGRLKLLFTEGTIFFSKSKNYSLNTTIPVKKRR
ncbi:MAG: glycosyltransferase [Pseudomonadota bacterium]